MKILLFSILLVSSFLTLGQRVMDIVFVKYNISDDSIKYKTDSVIFPSAMRRNMIFGTSKWPSSSNQYNLYYIYGLYFEKAESSDCLGQVLDFDTSFSTKISDIYINDSLWIIKIIISDNCCYSFLCDVKVVKESILQLDTYGYGTNHCDCDCFFELTYKIRRVDFEMSKNIKYVRIGEIKSTKRKIDNSKHNLPSIKM